ncbi:hypothetical protein CLIM01_14931 [Colletotrichum limetticola]|uniref:Uncharacterized protein n=1 Tax=Colletotrichum limetticola TaxID=1209924 RepID=A0ABQ9PBD8_9PEZI|nr:hypothetical protein CLIM01_14931 [Colletotrichum limetticola]
MPALPSCRLLMISGNFSLPLSRPCRAPALPMSSSSSSK